MSIFFSAHVGIDYKKNGLVAILRGKVAEQGTRQILNLLYALNFYNSH